MNSINLCLFIENIINLFIKILFFNFFNIKNSNCKLRFDKDGYARFWKVYQKDDGKLFSPCYPNEDGVQPGWIVSDRKSKEISIDNGDGMNYNRNNIEHGIHVFTRHVEARQYADEDVDVIVPIRCHKSQLVAVSSTEPEAVFMKVFLKKEDYKKAINNE